MGFSDRQQTFSYFAKSILGVLPLFAVDPLPRFGQEVPLREWKDQLLAHSSRKLFGFDRKLITECLIYIFPLSLRFVSGLFILHLTSSVGSMVIFRVYIFLLYFVHFVEAAEEAKEEN